MSVLHHKLILARQRNLSLPAQKTYPCPPKNLSLPAPKKPILHPPPPKKNLSLPAPKNLSLPAPKNLSLPGLNPNPAGPRPNLTYQQSFFLNNLTKPNLT